MALESLKLLEEKITGFLARHQRILVENENLSARLTEQERAYGILLGRLRKYEAERGEIRRRLEKILSHFDELGIHDGEKG